MPLILTREFTIANGASVSDEANIEQATPLGIFMPADWTAAGITLQVSRTRTTWHDVHDRAGAELVITTAAGRYVALEPSVLMVAGPWLRLRSGTAAAPVAQVAARVLGLSYRQFD